jgi:hypothetical protein
MHNSKLKMTTVGNFYCFWRETSAICNCFYNSQCMLHVRIHTESCEFWHKSLSPSFTVTIFALSYLQRTSPGARLLTLEKS